MNEQKIDLQKDACLTITFDELTKITIIKSLHELQKIDHFLKTKCFHGYCEIDKHIINLSKVVYYDIQ